MKDKINSIIKEQLVMLSVLDYEVDGKKVDVIPDKFNEIVFKSNNNKIIDTSEKQVIFEEYIIKPFPGFDFHKKFNKNIAPPSKIMFGFILKETEKMYYFKLRTDKNVYWEGWCPKKSCKVI